MLNELMPLWLTSQLIVGGLGFGTSLTGIVNGIAGFGNLMVLLFFYVPVARRLGPLDAYRMGHLVGIPAIGLLMPLVRYTLPNQGAMWTLLAVLCLCRSVGE